ncbi:MAG TPA: LysE family translocator [Candidatus Synoicihabitans sp.]|nr:LysE family translocator [Candidatus Synoicihabitans sp.]
MTLLSLVSFFGIMVVLASVPSASVALVLTRSATSGFRSGAAVAAGIVAADVLFVVLALTGLSTLAEVLGSFFVAIRVAAGLYLVWVGLALLRRKQEANPAPAAGGRALGSSFATGFLLTLGDLKAIFFYASLFPALFDLNAFDVPDVANILGVTIATVGGVKLAYAAAAGALARRISAVPAARWLNRCAGGLMIGTGVYVAAKP